MTQSASDQTKVAISTTQAPPPAHTFPQGVRKGALVQVSGQVPMDPSTGEFVSPGDVAGQTQRVLHNVLAVLQAGGASFDDVVMLRVYLTTRDDFAAMNTAYGQFVAEHTPSGVTPARTTVIAGLPRAEMLVEIDALAML